jgi:hypothetical protein
MIYILVHVTYDWHRFQENIAASRDLLGMTRAIEKFQKNNKGNYIFPIARTQKESQAFDSKEVCHLWIEKFKL